MKAIILERRGDEVAVLREDGLFARARHAGEIGETIELAEKVIAFPKKRHRGWMRTAVAAMLVLAITGGTLGYMGGTASAYVSLDVADSAIELSVNHFGRVIAVRALDETTEIFAEKLSGEVRSRPVESALDITMERLQNEGYLGEESGTVVVGVATDNGRRAAELKEFAERAIGRGGGHTAYVSELSRAEREQAMDAHCSAGRFGFERDHKEIPAQTETAPETRTEPEQPAEPAIPTGGAESNVTDAGSLQNIGQSVPEQGQPPQYGVQPTPGQEQFPQNVEQPTPEQDLPPREGEQPTPGQMQLPQDVGQSAPEQMQPPQSGEQPTQGQGQPSQNNGQGMPGEHGTNGQ